MKPGQRDALMQARLTDQAQQNRRVGMRGARACHGSCYPALLCIIRSNLDYIAHCFALYCAQFCAAFQCSMIHISAVSHFRLNWSNLIEVFPRFSFIPEGWRDNHDSRGTRFGQILAKFQLLPHANSGFRFADSMSNSTHNSRCFPPFFSLTCPTLPMLWAGRDR